MEDSIISAIKPILKLFMTDFQIEVFMACFWALVIGIIYSEFRGRSREKAREGRVTALEKLVGTIQTAFNTMQNVVNEMTKNVANLSAGLKAVTDSDSTSNKIFNEKLEEKATRQEVLEKALQELKEEFKLFKDKMQTLEGLINKGTTQ